MMTAREDLEPEVVEDAGQALRLLAELVGVALGSESEVHGTVEAS
jgi:hypothetical protein